MRCNVDITWSRILRKGECQQTTTNEIPLNHHNNNELFWSKISKTSNKHLILIFRLGNTYFTVAVGNHTFLLSPVAFLPIFKHPQFGYPVRSSNSTRKYPLPFPLSLPRIFPSFIKPSLPRQIYNMTSCPPLSRISMQGKKQHRRSLLRMFHFSPELPPTRLLNVKRLLGLDYALPPHFCVTTPPLPLLSSS